MNSTEFVSMAMQIAGLKTLYVKGGFGQKLTTNNKQYLIKSYKYNQERSAIINAATDDVYAFDCVNLVKGILWGFPKIKYCSDGVPDIGENVLIQKCKNVSTSFKNIVPGAFLWMDGHCGIYIGNGLCVESSPKWKNGVQVTAVGNLGIMAGYNKRNWTKWGLLPYVDYEDDEMVQTIKVSVDGKVVEVEAINKNGTNYIRLRDFDEKLGICKVDYDSLKKLPVISHA